MLLANVAAIVVYAARTHVFCTLQNPFNITSSITGQLKMFPEDNKSFGNSFDHQSKDKARSTTTVCLQRSLHDCICQKCRPGRGMRCHVTFCCLLE